MRLVFSRPRQIRQLKNAQMDLKKKIDSTLSQALYDQLSLQKLKRQVFTLQRQIVDLENKETPEIIA